MKESSNARLALIVWVTEGAGMDRRSRTVSTRSKRDNRSQDGHRMINRSH